MVCKRELKKGIENEELYFEKKVSKMKAVILCIFVLFLVYDNGDAKDFHKILSSKMKMAFRKKAIFNRPDKSADQAFRDLVEGKNPKRILFYGRIFLR